MNNQIDHIQYQSIRDAIRILDSASLWGNELDPYYRAMQVSNLAVVAHSAIEKGLKARLDKEGIEYSTRGWQGHDLPTLYGLTGQVQQGKWAKGLSTAYNDAIRYYEYDIAVLPHLSTLEDYLNKVGTGYALELMRYGLQDEGTADEAVNLCNHIMLPLHREILEALWRLVAYDDFFVVSQRVDRALARAMEGSLGYVTGSPDEEACKSVIEWLRAQPDFRTAMRQAVQQGYVVEGTNELGGQKVRQAFESLSKVDNPVLDTPSSADPAVAFFISSCRDLPRGVQLLYADAEVQIEWPNEHVAKVFSPGGEVLGFISRHVQSRWQVESLWDTSVAHSRQFEDAKSWLINRLCKQVSVISSGQTRKSHIISRDSFFPAMVIVTGIEDIDKPQEVELKFWDEQHGLQPGGQVCITLRYANDSEIGNRLEGVVNRVEGYRVWIMGRTLIGKVQ